MQLQIEVWRRGFERVSLSVGARWCTRADRSDHGVHGGARWRCTRRGWQSGALRGARSVAPRLADRRAALELREMIFADVNANYNYYVEADSHDDSHLVARHSVNPCRAEAVVVWRL